MVILVIQIIRITLDECEGDPPIAGHFDGPRTLPVPSQLVEIPAGYIQLFDFRSHINRVQPDLNLSGLLRWNAFRASRLEEPLESFVLPAFYHALSFI